MVATGKRFLGHNNPPAETLITHRSPTALDKLNDLDRDRITAHTFTLVTVLLALVLHGCRIPRQFLIEYVIHSLTPSLSHDAKSVKVGPTTLDL